MDSSKTPDARFWHASQCVGDRVYVWGGRTKSYRQERLTYFEEFDSNKRSWKTLTDVDPQDAHPAMSQVACASFSDFLYLFGGNNGKELNNTLSKLDLKEKKWKRLAQGENASSSPMKKDACGMAHFTTQSGEHLLIVMCGYTKKGHSTDIKSEFSLNKNSTDGVSGWTNEIHMFDIAKDDWLVPKITGTRPEPCADVTFTSIDKQRGVFFGGRKEICLYLIDINSMNIEVCEYKSRSPPKRLGLHDVSCIGYNSENPCLLMSGGRRDSSKDSEPLSDIWIFNPQSRKWKEEKVPDHDKMARWGHTIAVIMHSDYLVEVLMFGGSSEPYNAHDLDNIQRLAQPVSLIYGYHCNEWTLIGVVDNIESWKFGKQVRELPMLQVESAAATAQGSQPHYISGLQGVEVLQKTTLTVTNSERTFEWEGYGLKLHIPENSLPSDTKQITLTIIASIAGHYTFPDNSSQFAGVYWFCYEPLNVKPQLKKPIKLEIQHCAKSESISNLKFVRASSNQDKLPYTFKYLKGGDFTSCNSYGTLEVTNFCGITIVGEPEAKEYLASLFYLRHTRVYWDIRFAVTLDTELHRRACEKEFSKKPYTEVSVDFESDEITLNIPQGTLDGWMLGQNAYPMVKKATVDNFLPGRSIPHCQIFAYLMDSGRTRGQILHRCINLQGAKAPSDYVNIVLLTDSEGTNGSLIGSTFARECDFSAVSSSELNSDCLRDVVCEMTSRKSSYYALGRGLGLKVDILESIQRQWESKDLDRALSEVLLAWLRSEKPTWQMLVRAVADQGGLNEPALARNIASRHPSSMQ